MKKITLAPGPSTHLSTQQKNQFHQDGFLALASVLSPNALEPLILELSEKVETGVQAAVAAGFLAPEQTYPNAPFATRLALVSSACTDPDWIWLNFFRNQKPRSAGMFTLRTTPALLTIVESLIGPEILAHPQFNFRAKMPGQENTVIPWHQDLAYLTPEEAGDTLVVNAWIPLVTATAQNGCMQIIRGSHHHQLLPHNLREEKVGHTGSKGIRTDELPTGEIITAALEVGDILLTSERLVHRGLPNTANTVRWSVDSRYCQIGLPNGRKNVPGFVAHSHKMPEQIAQNVEAWEQLFTTA